MCFCARVMLLHVGYCYPFIYDTYDQTHSTDWYPLIVDSAGCGTRYVSCEWSPMWFTPKRDKYTVDGMHESKYSNFLFLQDA